MTRRDALFWSCLAAAIVASRLCHINILWADEDYHLAAAIQTLHGKLPYRDFWYDKPPLNLAFYLLFGAKTGMALRLADSAFVLLCCALAFLWERYAAAALLAFFLIFYLPSGVMPLEPDTLMVLPHLAAVYLAWKRQPFWAGVAAGIAFQLNVRGVFVLAFAALFCWPAMPALAAGFLAPNLVVLGWLAAAGALPPYWQQVWRWGWLYAASGTSGGFRALLGWLGFHAALLVAAVAYWRRAPSRTLAWFALALLFILGELKFAPRYFNLLLPPLAIASGAAFRLRKDSRVLGCVFIALLAIPAVRFGPRYIELAREDFAGAPHTWRDVAMDQESRQAAAVVTAAAQPGDTVFVWGYRPDVVAYTRLPVAGRIWDSQPATGVPADRHLSSARPVDEGWARENREELARTAPVFLVDGLSRYNPELDIRRYPELAAWLSRYCEIGRAGATAVYRLCETGNQTGPPGAEKGRFRP